MKIKGLYDGGILIFVGVFLIALGLSAVSVGVKKVNRRVDREQKESQKPLIIPMPPPKEKSVEQPKEEDEWVIAYDPLPDRLRPPILVPTAAPPDPTPEPIAEKPWYQFW